MICIIPSLRCECQPPKTYFPSRILQKDITVVIKRSTAGECCYYFIYLRTSNRGYFSIYNEKKNSFIVLYQSVSV